MCYNVYIYEPSLLLAFSISEDRNKIYTDRNSFNISKFEELWKKGLSRDLWGIHLKLKKGLRTSDPNS